VSKAISTLREWSLDWLDRSTIQASARRIDDPLTLLPRIFAVLAGITSVLSSPAVNVLLPHLNPIAANLLRASVTLAALAVLNYVVTAKDTVETLAGINVRPEQRYRFSATERLIARGVIVLAILLLGLNFIPSPGDCNLTARIVAQPGQRPARPLLLFVSAEESRDELPILEGQPLVIHVSATDVSSFSLTLLWSDNSRSEFGTFSGCTPLVDKGSTDGRAKISLAVR
jgi:hypothetical protein